MAAKGSAGLPLSKRVIVPSIRLETFDAATTRCLLYLTYATFAAAIACTVVLRLGYDRRSLNVDGLLPCNASAVIPFSNGSVPDSDDVEAFGCVQPYTTLSPNGSLWTGYLTGLSRFDGSLALSIDFPGNTGLRPALAQPQYDVLIDGYAGDEDSDADVSVDAPQPHNYAQAGFDDSPGGDISAAELSAELPLVGAAGDWAPVSRLINSTFTMRCNEVQPSEVRAVAMQTRRQRRLGSQAAELPAYLAVGAGYPVSCAGATLYDSAWSTYGQGGSGGYTVYRLSVVYHDTSMAAFASNATYAISYQVAAFRASEAALRLAFMVVSLLTAVLWLRNMLWRKVRVLAVPTPASTDSSTAAAAEGGAGAVTIQRVWTPPRRWLPQQKWVGLLLLVTFLWLNPLYVASQLLPANRCVEQGGGGVACGVPWQLFLASAILEVTGWAALFAFWWTLVDGMKVPRSEVEALAGRHAVSRASKAASGGAGGTTAALTARGSAAAGVSPSGATPWGHQGSGHAAAGAAEVGAGRPLGSASPAPGPGPVAVGGAFPVGPDRSATRLAAAAVLLALTDASGVGEAGEEAGAGAAAAGAAGALGSGSPSPWVPAGTAHGAGSGGPVSLPTEATGRAAAGSVASAAGAGIVGVAGAEFQDEEEDEEEPPLPPTVPVGPYTVPSHVFLSAFGHFLEGALGPSVDEDGLGAGVVEAAAAMGARSRAPSAAGGGLTSPTASASASATTMTGAGLSGASFTPRPVVSDNGMVVAVGGSGAPSGGVVTAGNPFRDASLASVGSASSAASSALSTAAGVGGSGVAAARRRASSIGAEARAKAGGSAATKRRSRAGAGCCRRCARRFDWYCWCGAVAVQHRASTMYGVRYYPSSEDDGWAFYWPKVLFFLALTLVGSALEALSQPDLLFGGRGDPDNPLSHPDGARRLLTAVIVLGGAYVTLLVLWLALFLWANVTTGKQLERLPYVATRYQQLSYRFFIFQQIVVVLFVVAVNLYPLILFLIDIWRHPIVAPASGDVAGDSSSSSGFTLDRRALADPAFGGSWAAANSGVVPDSTGSWVLCLLSHVPAFPLSQPHSAAAGPAPTSVAGRILGATGLLGLRDSGSGSSIGLSVETQVASAIRSLTEAVTPIGELLIVSVYVWVLAYYYSPPKHALPPGLVGESAEGEEAARQQEAEAAAAASASSPGGGQAGLLPSSASSAALIPLSGSLAAAREPSRSMFPRLGQAGYAGASFAGAGRGFGAGDGNGSPRDAFGASAGGPGTAAAAAGGRGGGLTAGEAQALTQARIRSLSPGNRRSVTWGATPLASAAPAFDAAAAGSGGYGGGGGAGLRAAGGRGGHTPLARAPSMSLRHVVQAVASAPTQAVNKASKAAHAMRAALEETLLGLPPDAGNHRFSTSTAAWLFDFAMAVYFDPALEGVEVTPSSYGPIPVAPHGFQFEGVAYSRETDTMAWVCRQGHRVVVAFRGTVTTQNVSTDLKIRPEAVEFGVDTDTTGHSVAVTQPTTTLGAATAAASASAAADAPLVIEPPSRLRGGGVGDKVASARPAAPSTPALASRDLRARLAAAAESTAAASAAGGVASSAGSGLRSASSRRAPSAATAISHAASAAAASAAQDHQAPSVAAAIPGVRMALPLVHQGFWRAYASIRPQLKSMVRSALVSAGMQGRIYTTGHSLGGALATLAAYDLHPLVAEAREALVTLAPGVGESLGLGPGLSAAPVAPRAGLGWGASASGPLQASSSAAGWSLAPAAPAQRARGGAAEGGPRMGREGSRLRLASAWRADDSGAAGLVPAAGDLGALGSAVGAGLALSPHRGGASDWPTARSGGAGTGAAGGSGGGIASRPRSVAPSRDAAAAAAYGHAGSSASGAGVGGGLPPSGLPHTHTHGRHGHGASSTSSVASGASSSASAAAALGPYARYLLSQGVSASVLTGPAGGAPGGSSAGSGTARPGVGSPEGPGSSVAGMPDNYATLPAHSAAAAGGRRVLSWAGVSPGIAGAAVGSAGFVPASAVTGVVEEDEEEDEEGGRGSSGGGAAGAAAGGLGSRSPATDGLRSGRYAAMKRPESSRHAAALIAAAQQQQLQQQHAAALAAAGGGRGGGDYGAVVGTAGAGLAGGPRSLKEPLLPGAGASGPSLAAASSRGAGAVLRAAQYAGGLLQLQGGSGGADSSPFLLGALNGGGPAYGGALSSDPWADSPSGGQGIGRHPSAGHFAAGGAGSGAGGGGAGGGGGLLSPIEILLDDDVLEGQDPLDCVGVPPQEDEGADAELNLLLAGGGGVGAGGLLGAAAAASPVIRNSRDPNQKRPRSIFAGGRGSREAVAANGGRPASTAASSATASFFSSLTGGGSGGGGLFGLASTETDVVCYSFGSPRVGNHTFARAYNARVPFSFRVVFDGDIVTSMPPKVSPTGCGSIAVYKHVGLEVWCDGAGNVLVDPSFVERTFRARSKTSLRAHRMSSYRRALLHARRNEGLLQWREWVLSLLPPTAWNALLTLAVTPELALASPADEEGEGGDGAEGNAPGDSDGSGGGARRPGSGTLLDSSGTAAAGRPASGGYRSHAGSSFEGSSGRHQHALS